MSKNVVADYIYEGLGFPVKLKQVEMILIQNELHPLVDVRKVAAQALQALLTQKETYTGDQIAFVRVCFSLTQKQLAKLVNEPVKSVQAWEQAQEKPAAISAASDNLLKKYMHQELHKSSQLLAKKGLFSSPQSKPKPAPDVDLDNDVPKKKR